MPDTGDTAPPNPDARPPRQAAKQQPSVGRVVHFCRGSASGGVVHLAAMIVFVHANGTVNLKVFGNGYEVHSDYLAMSVAEGGHDDIGTWSFPPFVPPK